MKPPLPLTNFPKTRRTLEKRGISFETQVKRYIPSSRIIDDINAKSNSLEISEKGIFYTYPDGLRTRGYLCLLGNGDSTYPEAHICECPVLHKYKSSGKTDRFVWASKRKIFIKVSGGIQEVQGLDICLGCLQSLRSYRISDLPTNTNDFVDRLEKNMDDELFPSSHGEDSYDKSPEWYAARRTLLEKKGYTCEKCGRSFYPIHLRPFIDVVPSSEKTGQGLYNNLKCLCIGCQRSLYPERFSNPFQLSVFDMYVNELCSSEKKTAIQKIIASLIGKPEPMYPSGNVDAAGT